VQNAVNFAYSDIHVTPSVRSWQGEQYHWCMAMSWCVAHFS